MYPALINAFGHSPSYRLGFDMDFTYRREEDVKQWLQQLTESTCQAADECIGLNFEAALIPNQISLLVIVGIRQFISYGNRFKFTQIIIKHYAQNNFYSFLIDL